MQSSADNFAYNTFRKYFMPIYEYRCNECGTHVERRQSISEAPLTICDKCGGLLEKQVSLSGFQFKGAGWYVTDYAAKKAPGGEAKSDKGEKTSGAESTAKADDASNTKSDTPSTPKTETAAKKE